MAEAVAPEVGKRQVPEEAKNLLGRVLSSGQFVTLVQTTPSIGGRARDLRWTDEIVLKGADALHLASALELKCAEFITTDERILKLSESSIGIQLVRPSETKHLPDEYRRNDMLTGNDGE